MTGSAKNTVTLSVYPSFKNTVQNAIGKIDENDSNENDEDKVYFKLSDDQKPMKRVENFIGEFLGTFLLVLLGCMGCVDGITGNTLTHFQLAFSFGMAVLIPIQIFAHTSGGHINPVMTITSFMLGKTSLLTTGIYFVAQMAGATIGYAVILAVNPRDFIRPEGAAVGLCSPHVNGHITVMQGLIVEFLLSLALVWLACSVWDIRNRDRHDSVAIKFGLGVAGLAIVGGHYTGCNMNPARSFGPALLNGDWEHHWVYWVGPILAAILGGAFYRAVFKADPPKPVEPESYALNDK